MNHFPKLALLSFLLCSLLFTACSENAIDTSRDLVVGNWSQVSPSCTNDCAFINFQASEFVRSDLNYIDGNSYEVVDEDVLRIGNNTYFYNFTDSYQRLEILDLLQDSLGNTTAISLVKN